MPNLFGLCEDRGVSWNVYFDPSQVVPDCAINVAGLRHLRMWKQRTLERERFFADAAAGTLPAYSWVEPKLMFGELDDYHPPTDIRAAERFLSQVYEAVRGSPAWERTALLILFDEHGGCYDHVPPPAAPIPDDSPGSRASPSTASAFACRRSSSPLIRSAAPWSATISRRRRCCGRCASASTSARR